MTALIIFQVFGLILFVAGLFTIANSRFEEDSVIGKTMTFLGIIMIVIGMFIHPKEQPNHNHNHDLINRFPASEYNLKLSITDYNGQKDTTYVLVRKITD